MTTTTLKIKDIIPNPQQPRKDFNAQQLQELADSIKSVGLKEPVEVRPLGNNGKFQLVDGERRFRACKDLLQLKEIAAKIRDDIKSEEDAAIQSFIINDQRSSYTPQDKEAYIFHLYKTTGLSIRKLADKLGVHHSAIDHYLEAYRFRQKLPPTKVGTPLQVTHSALKNTAIVKDDNLRIKLLEALQNGKIKSASELQKISEVLKDAPKALYEAYFAELIDWPNVVSVLRWTEDCGPEALGLYSKEIPLELKKDIINGWPLLQAAVVPDLLNWLIEKEIEDKHNFIEQYISLNPHKDANYVREYAEKQIKKWKIEYKKSVKDALSNFKKKYEEDAEGTKGVSIDGLRGRSFWIEVYYLIVTSIGVIQQTPHLKDDIDTRTAIVDMLHTNELLLGMMAGGGETDAIDKVKIPEENNADDNNDDDDDEDKEEDEDDVLHEKTRAENDRIEKIMTGAADEDKEEGQSEEL